MGRAAPSNRALTYSSARPIISEALYSYTSVIERLCTAQLDWTFSYLVRKMPPKSQQPTRSSSAQDASINESSTGPRATTSTVDNPSTTAGQSRQGVTRLDTLAKRGGSAAAAKPLKIQPKAVGRRSLLEREEAEREEQRRLDTRTTTAADASGSSSNRGLSGHGRGDSFRARGWQRGGGWFGGRGGTRSGYAMPLPERVGEGMASGPFGAGSVLSGM